MRRAVPFLIVLLALVLGACGEERPPVAPVPEAKAEDAPAPEAKPGVPLDERARFALARLLQGPLPRTTAFRIPHLHPVTLQMALEDLVLLREPTLALLEDPNLLADVTRTTGARNPWHGILDVLARLEDPPPELVLAWTKPAFDTDDVALMRRAAEVLGQAGDEGAGPALLAALEARPADREIARSAGRGLVRLGDPWRARALGILQAGGTRLAQGLVAAWLDAEEADDALAWWALLAEIGGPVPTADLHPWIVPAFNVARVVASDEVWPPAPAAIDAALQRGRLLAPAHLRDAVAMRPVPPGASPHVPLERLRQDAAVAAADARCRLAREGHRPWVNAVLADRVGADPLRQIVARDCFLPAEDAETARLEAEALIETFLDAVAGGPGADAAGVAGALARLEDAALRDALAWRILEEVRPPSAYGPLLQAAHDLLAEGDRDAAVAWVLEAAASPDADTRAVALHLMRASPHVAYLAPLERWVDAAEEGGPRTQLVKLLTWVASRGQGVAPERRAAVARRFATEVERTPDPWAAALAPGLLDLGPAGIEAYAKGLAGPRRDAYVQGLIARGAVVPPAVAAALLAEVDADTPRDARHAAWIAAYLTAPAEAAGAVAAARDRVDPAHRDEVGDVLEVVRHRAPR